MILGETGTGKTWIGCYIAAAAIRSAIRSRCYNINDLLYELTLARADENYLRFKSKLEKYGLLVLDHFGVAPMTQQGKSDLLAIFEDRVKNEVNGVCWPTALQRLVRLHS